MCEFVSKLTEQFMEITNDTSNFEQSTFENMPVEIILHICSYLDPYFLRNTFSKICRRFADILADDHLWKHWVHSKVKGVFPTSLTFNENNHIDINWEDVCVDMDYERRRWCKVERTMNHIVVKDVHYASVDAVLLVNNGELCVSGGRDRGMALWRVHDIIPNKASDKSVTLSDAKPKQFKHNAHSGWVWDLAPDNIDCANKIFSASWDNTVKVWDIATGLECIQTFKCGMTALSVVCTQDIVMAGLYSKKILSFDLRAGSNPVNVYKPHKGPVLALHSFNNKVASISEDKTLAVWDSVAGKLVINDIKIPTEKSPTCINWSPTALYIGDTNRSLHLMNPETFAHIKTHMVWPEAAINKAFNKITSCYQSCGTLILCSDRGEIKFFYNSYPPHEYTSIRAATREVTRMRYLNGVMVVGTCDSALEFWLADNHYSYDNEE